MKLSAIIINYNTQEKTTEAVEDFLAAAEGFDFEVVLIDNASKEVPSWPSASWGERVKFIYNQKNLGFAGAANQGLLKALGEYVILLNSDALINKKTLTAMLDCLQANDSIGAVGPSFIYPDGSFQTSSGYFPTPWNFTTSFLMLSKILPTGFLLYRNFFNRLSFTSSTSPLKVDWLSGGCLLFKKSLIKEIGLLDENFFFGVEDLDYCYRIKKSGRLIIYLPFVSVIHSHGFSSGGRRSASKLKKELDGMIYFLKKHFPKKRLFRAWVRFLYFVKIALFKLLLIR